jgi:5-methylcytosine-specific restriction endonuclease McrA
VSDRYYRSSAWRRLRDDALRRQPVCATPGCGQRATFADHIIPRRQGGADALGNLQSLCSSCHSNRWRGREPVAKGAHADGTPRSPTHWWNQ